MDTIKARAIAEEELRVWGLTEKGWRFDYDTAVRRFGCCKHRRKLITLSYEITKLNSEYEVVDTIRHEIAHALATMLTGRKHGHNYIWKRYCLFVGADPTRCYDSKIVATPERKYKGTCPNGHVIYRHRLGKVRKSSCAQCSRKYDPRYLFNWELNNAYD